MTLSSSWIKVLFIIALAFPLYSETAFLISSNSRDPPDCKAYEHPQVCTREKDPVCATNGRTYSNPCIFCNEKLESKEEFKFNHYGTC